MAEGKQFTCACGWTITSPLGEEDVLKHAEMHANEYHPDLNLTREQLRRDVKSVQMPMPTTM